jgi:hypothetical protein
MPLAPPIDAIQQPAVGIYGLPVGASAGAMVLLTAAQIRAIAEAGTSSFDGAYSSLSGVPSTFAPSSHTHGNITNAGAIGSTTGLPIITTASGVLTAGSFGATAGTFAAGDDSRITGALSSATAATTYQPLDSDLTAIAALTPTNDDFVQRKAGVWANRTVAQVKTDLSLTGTNSGDQDLSSYATTASVVAGYQPLENRLTAITNMEAINYGLMQFRFGALLVRSIPQIKIDLGLDGYNTGDQDLTSYLTSATAASTYATIAAGQPVSGTVGQVLTKNSGTNQIICTVRLSRTTQGPGR